MRAPRLPVCAIIGFKKNIYIKREIGEQKKHVDFLTMSIDSKAFSPATRAEDPPNQQ